jgi:hypothetical protein
MLFGDCNETLAWGSWTAGGCSRGDAASPGTVRDTGNADVARPGSVSDTVRGDVARWEAMSDTGATSSLLLRPLLGATLSLVSRILRRTLSMECISDGQKVMAFE